MKHLFLISILFLFCNSIRAQTIQQIDSVAAKMCESLSYIKNINYDTQVTMLFHKHLPDFYRRVNVNSQSVADSINNKIYYRLQRNCDAFIQVLNKLVENKSDWIKLPQKPKTTISKDDCNLVLKEGNYY